MNLATATDFLLQAEALLDARELQPALELFYRAEVLGEDEDRCAAGRWVAHMLAGDFGSAWKESDAIRSRGNSDPHRYWQGESIARKRVVVRCLHGLGDTVQFIRYADLLEMSAASVVWEVQPGLVELASCFAGVRKVTTWGLERTQWDVQVEVMELPYIFQTDLAELPIASNYLQLPAETDPAFASGDGPRIGVVWSAGEWNLSRSMPLHLILPLLARWDCEFWNLQGGPVRKAWTELECPRLRDIPACDAGVFSMARVISQLDLVITVDTLAAHLAGALGVPAWIMLGHSADWRWMIDRTDSPWYPSVRLFRQPSPGDWISVVASVEESLNEWVARAQRRWAA